MPPVVSTAPASTPGDIAEQLRGSGIGFGDLTATFAPMLDVLWPVLRFVLLVAVPALLVAGVGYFAFMRWSQAGSTSL